MTIPLAIGLFASLAGGADGPTHEENATLAAVIAEGMAVGDRAVRLPGPTFTDGQSAEVQREEIRKLAGSDRAVENFLRDSVTAPFVLSIRDDRADGATIRAGDLYFALRVDLDTIDPASLLVIGDGEPVEAGNMRFEARALDEGEAPPDAAPGDRFVHSTGRLLDRIAVESTSLIAGSRSADSVVVASRTDRRFDGQDRWPNRWRTIEGRGDRSSYGPDRPFDGGIGYAKLTRLAGEPGTVIVELHFAFAEPTAWFDGAPILRSKFSLIAQDQIRRLRRELSRGAPER